MNQNQNQVKHGPHGGSWLKIETGFIEISVFETGIPPRFRLYFYDVNEKLISVLPPSDVKLDTVRPNGQKQTFTFNQQNDYLEATAELPEPHEFTVNLMITYQGHEYTYSTQFTEEDHGHTHTHHGILGWFKHQIEHALEHMHIHGYSHPHSHSHDVVQSPNVAGSSS